MKEQVTCIRCNKVFWRHKLKKNQVETLGDCLCQYCKNVIRYELQKGNVKVIENDKYVNMLKLNIDKLIKLEKIKPELIEQLRKSKSDINER